jgi:hypothetical protein
MPIRSSRTEITRSAPVSRRRGFFVPGIYHPNGVANRTDVGAPKTITGMPLGSPQMPGDTRSFEDHTAYAGFQDQPVRESCCDHGRSVVERATPDELETGRVP